MRSAVLIATLLASCDDLDTGGKIDTGFGDESCCFFACEGDVAEGWVSWPASSAECQDHADTQCAGVGVQSWDYVVGCSDCDSC